MTRTQPPVDAAEQAGASRSVSLVLDGNPKQDEVWTLTLDDVNGDIFAPLDPPSHTISGGNTDNSPGKVANFLFAQLRIGRPATIAPIRNRK